MASQIASVIGRKVRFENITEDEARTQQVDWDAPGTLVDARLSIFRAIKERIGWPHGTPVGKDISVKVED